MSPPRLRPPRLSPPGLSPPGLMELGVRPAGSQAVNVVIETPRGSRNKYRYDEAHGVFLLHKLLPMGAAFPFDFGFVPGTRAEDGDPLDVMVLGEEPTFTGCLVTVRVLGVLEAEEKKQGRTIRNDRILGTPETRKIRPRERSLADVPSRLLDQIEHFFSAYNQAEKREFAIVGRRGPRVAATLIDRAARAYRASQRGEGGRSRV